MRPGTVVSGYSWVNYVPFMERKAYMCITHPGKPVYTVIIYFSYVTMKSCPSEVAGIWITCSISPDC